MRCRGARQVAAMLLGHGSPKWPKGALPQACPPVTQRRQSCAATRFRSACNANHPRLSPGTRLRPPCLDIIARGLSRLPLAMVWSCAGKPCCRKFRCWRRKHQLRMARSELPGEGRPGPPHCSGRDGRASVTRLAKTTRVLSTGTNGGTHWLCLSARSDRRHYFLPQPRNRASPASVSQRREPTRRPGRTALRCPWCLGPKRRRAA
mmetsp:Transcript_101897/g.287546  ORF Transcript_101897/g.287546 Transcript_101897/m.287546 type:complete len:206 (-) Transcript_101897:687-1304(-)